MGLLVTLGVETKEFTKGLKAAQRDFNQLGNELKKIGTNLSVSVTAPIAGAAAAIFRFSKEATYQFKLFGESVAGSIGAMGDDLARAIDLKGILATISQAVKSATEAFIALPDPVKRVTVTVLAFLAALGPMILIAGQLIITLGAIGAALSGPIGITIGIAAAVVGIGILSAEILGIMPTMEQWKQLAKDIGFYLVEAARAMSQLGMVAKFYKSGVGAVLGDMFGTVTGNLVRGLMGTEQRIRSEAAAAERASEANRKYNQSWQQLRTTLGQINTEKDLGMISALEAAEKERAARKTFIGNVGGLEGMTPSALEGQKKKVDELDTKLDSVESHLTKLFERLPSISSQIASAIFDIFQGLSQGIGNAVAQIIVYGADIAETFASLGKQILATIVSTLVQIAIQWVISSLVGTTLAAGRLATELATNAAIAYSATYAGWCNVPFVGPGLGAAAGAAAVAGMLGGAAGAYATGAGAGAGLGAGGVAIGAAAEGGIFTKPFLIGEAGGPEIALNKRNVREFLGVGSGTGTLTVNLNLDGKRITRKVLKLTPDVLMQYAGVQG